MKILTYEEFNKNIYFYINQANAWKIFIYPTDTIYGLWTIISDNSIAQIKNIKNRWQNKNFSIIAPDNERIKHNFITTSDFDSKLNYYLNKYHWITLLCTRKDPNFLKNISINEKIGIRILNHPFQEFIKKLWQPFITTSVNISWQNHIKEINEIPNEIYKSVDFIIDEWKLDGKPSILIDIYNDTIKQRN